MSGRRLCPPPSRAPVYDRILAIGANGVFIVGADISGGGDVSGMVVAKALPSPSALACRDPELAKRIGRRVKR